MKLSPVVLALLLEHKAEREGKTDLELMLREARDEPAVVLEFVVTRAAHLLGVELG